MNTGKIVLGVIAGVAAGALLGMLFAPEKGTETRKKISKKGLELKDELQGKFDDFLSSISEKFESVSNDGGHIAEKAKSKIENVKKEFKTSTTNGSYSSHV